MLPTCCPQTRLRLAPLHILTQPVILNFSHSNARILGPLAHVLNDKSGKGGASTPIFQPGLKCRAWVDHLAVVRAGAEGERPAQIRKCAKCGRVPFLEWARNTAYSRRPGCGGSAPGGLLLHIKGAGEHSKSAFVCFRIIFWDKISDRWLISSKERYKYFFPNNVRFLSTDYLWPVEPLSV